jgi:hypothetical protein
MRKSIQGAGVAAPMGLASGGSFERFKNLVAWRLGDPGKAC